MIALYIFLILILIILLMPVGLHAKYNDGNYLVAARALLFDIKLVSSDDEEEPEKKKSSSKKQKKSDKKSGKERKKAEKKPRSKPDFEISEIMDLIYLALDALGRFKRKFKVNKFKLHFISASEDPYDTVAYFNLAGMILEAVQSFSRKSCVLCSSDVKTGMDFEAREPSVDLDLVITINLLRIISVLIYAGTGFIKIRKAYKEPENINLNLDNEGTINYGSVS